MGDPDRQGWRELVPSVEDLRSTARLALPIVIIQMGLMGMGVVDTVMVGHSSPVDLAAVALGSLYFWACGTFGMGTLMALDPVVAQAVGAGDEEAIARGIQRGGLIAVFMSLILAALLVPATPLLHLLRQPDDVVPVAAGYCVASIPGALPFYLFIVLRQSLQAMGRMRPIIIVILGANVLNVILNWIFVFGNLGVPPMGAVGSAWASSLARWFMAAGLLVVAWEVLRPHLVPLRREARTPGPMLRMVRLGAPIGIQFLLEFGAFGIIGLMMGWLGTIAMAGHQVALSLASFTFMVPLGVSAGSAVLVGHAVGRGDAGGARRAAGAGLAMGGGFMAVAALVLLLLPGPLARAYTADAQVLAVAVALIPVAGVFQVFDGLQVVSTGVLRGIGDTRAPMVVNVLGFWLIGMPISGLFGFRLGGGPLGLWWGLATGLAAVAIFLLFRIRVRFSRRLQRLVIEEEALEGA